MANWGAFAGGMASGIATGRALNQRDRALGMEQQKIGMEQKKLDKQTAFNQWMKQFIEGYGKPAAAPGTAGDWGTAAADGNAAPSAKPAPNWGTGAEDGNAGQQPDEPAFGIFDQER